MEDAILFVDDDPSLLAAMKRQLHKGFNITLAQGGDEALAMVSRANAQKEPFAVVVCDMRMPGMDGIELLKRIRALSPDTMRIMLTGRADQQTAADAINKGHVFRFFSKPCPAEELAEGLSAALEQYRAVAAEHRLLASLGYPRARGAALQAPDAFDSTEPSGFGENRGSPDRLASAPAEEERAKQLATAAETRKSIQDMVGYDIVNHDRLLALAENIWRSVPDEDRAKYTSKDWQEDIYEKCRDSLMKAEKKLAESNPEPRMLKANINILRSAFARQVVRAMQEISVYYREYAAKAQGKATPK